MSDDEDTAPLLPGELERALANAMGSAVGSLDNLRVTLRRHVRGQRSRGTSLTAIDTEVQHLVERIEERSRPPGDDSPDGELASQIRKWNAAFYAGGKV
jgi:hypothetical protein